VRLEGLGQLKKSTSSGSRTCDLPACRIVPQPTTLPRAHLPNGLYCRICLGILYSAILCMWSKQLYLYSSLSPLHLIPNVFNLLSLSVIQSGSGRMSPSFLNSTLDGGNWSASRPCRFTSGYRAIGILLDWRLDGPQSRSGRCAEE
jgi:hypothetical protein